MSSQFYTSIASHYDHIFPFNPAQIEFLRNVIPYNGAKILDVGCATGNMTFALTHFGFPTWAFDFDAQMVDIALKSKSEDTMFPIIEQLDMRLIDERYPENFFDTVLCFGNTLVHLLTDDDTRKFIQAAYRVLSPEGKLTIQILNYQHIVDQKIKSLPTIDNEHVSFERNYVFSGETNLIDFHTKLLVKSTGQVIENRVQLCAIRKNRLQEILLECGFSNLEFYGSFNSEALLENSLQLIVSCQK